jgi:hypothetical protein
LKRLYASLEETTSTIKSFLEDNGINANDINLSTPAITGKSAQQYGNSPDLNFAILLFKP